MRLSLYNASIIAGIWKATAKQFVGRSISSPPTGLWNDPFWKPRALSSNWSGKKNPTEHKQK